MKKRNYGVSPLCLALVELIRQLAREVIMPSYLKAARSHKADGSLCTETDIAAQAWLAERLPVFAELPALGEEMIPEEQRLTWEQSSDGLWIIDPIDGTTNFVNGIPFFTTSVALYRNQRPVIGVVYNPATEEAFYAEKGCGAYLNGMRLPLRPAHPDLKQAVAGIDFKRIPRELADRLATQPPFFSQRHFGSSCLEWCYIAAGRLDVYLHGGQMLWDYAAGRLIVEEAGGAFCSLEQGDFDAASPWKRSVVAAATPRLHRQWTAALAGEPPLIV